MDSDKMPPLLNMDGENVAIASGIQRRQSLRLRGSNGSLNAQMYPGLRRSSTLQGRKFSQSSMEGFLPPRFQQTAAKPEENDEQPSTASSKLLLFFAVPVIAGILFENGASLAVDLVLVGLAALMLYWSLEVPWQWYYYARRLAIDEWMEYQGSEETIVDDGEEHEDAPNDDASSAADQKDDERSPSKADGTEEKRKSREWRTLQAYELLALTSCFISPAATSYVLHRIRQYLARPAGSPVENGSFILFVMAAEILPLRQVCKLLFAHTLYLQRVVTSYDVFETNKLKGLQADLEKERSELAELKRRFEELESAQSIRSPSSAEGKAASAATSSTTDTKGNTMQTQVNALNRAVRQYEKRAITQQIVTEARLRDLEARINDALTLAAAASRSTQDANPLWSFASSVVLLPINAAQTIISLPLLAFAEVHRFLLGPRKRKKKGADRIRHETVTVTKSRSSERTP